MFEYPWKAVISHVDVEKICIRPSSILLQLFSVDEEHARKAHTHAQKIFCFCNSEINLFLFYSISKMENMTGSEAGKSSKNTALVIWQPKNEKENHENCSDAVLNKRENLAPPFQGTAANKKGKKKKVKWQTT